MGCISSRSATGAAEIKPRIPQVFVPTHQLAWLIDTQ